MNARPLPVILGLSQNPPPTEAGDTPRARAACDTLCHENGYAVPRNLVSPVAIAPGWTLGQAQGDEQTPARTLSDILGLSQNPPPAQAGGTQCHENGYAVLRGAVSPVAIAPGWTLGQAQGDEQEHARSLSVILGLSQNPVARDSGRRLQSVRSTRHTTSFVIPARSAGIFGRASGQPHPRACGARDTQPKGTNNDA
jgi:hypothetical protein